MSGSRSAGRSRWGARGKVREKISQRVGRRGTSRTQNRERKNRDLLEDRRKGVTRENRIRTKKEMWG